MALLIVIAGVIAVGLGLIVFIGVSLAQLISSLPAYMADLAEQKEALRAWLSGIDIIDMTDGIRLLDFFDIGQVSGWLGAFLGGMGNFLGDSFFVLMTMAFVLLEAWSLPSKLQEGLGANNPLLADFAQFSQSVVRFFVLRAGINLLMATAVTIMLLILGIDFALLWGILTFFLSYVPYIGIVLATAPSVILALLQYGPRTALVVIVGVMIINLGTDNVLTPRVMGRGMNLSPAVVFLAFVFWSWLLGPLGMFLSMPLTVILQLVLANYEETRWLAILMSAPRATQAAAASDDSAE